MKNVIYVRLKDLMSCFAWVFKPRPLSDVFKHTTSRGLDLPLPSGMVNGASTLWGLLERA